MPEIAMYYPYTHIRDDNWLKAAALYWPKLARLTPPGYPRHDSEVAKALHNELGFFVNIEPPATQVAQVAGEFLEFIAVNNTELKNRYQPGSSEYCVPLWHDAQQEMLQVNCNWHTHKQGTVHVQKMTGALRAELVDSRLGLLIEQGNWLVVHPAISAAYTMTLVDRIAQANGLAVVTDQPTLHELHGGGVGNEFAMTLLETRDETKGTVVRQTDDVANMYASIAVKAVIPNNIENIPTTKIIKARTKLAAEFDVFREHLDTLAEEFAKLAQVENMTILMEELQMLVDRDLRRPTAALERSLRQLGLEPATAVLGLKTLELPAIAAAATSLAGIPIAASQAGLATARLVAAGIQTRSRRRDARHNSPVGYLLGLKQQIGRRGLLDRVRRPRG